MSKYLQRRGHDVEILTTGAFGSLPDDREQRIHRTRDLIAAGWLRRLLRRPPLPSPGEAAADDTPVPAIATRLLVPDLYVATWVPYALLAARRLLRERPFDCIVTTSAYESTHLIGLALGARRPGWVADFRDGWTFQSHRLPWPTEAQRRLDRRLERLVVESADRTTVVERPVGADLRARLGVDAIHVPNGWDPELEQEARSANLPELGDGRLILVHTGKLSGGWGRHPGTLFEAMSLLRDRTPHVAERIQLVLAGRLDVAERQLIESAGLGSMLRHLGQLSREQALALQRRADVLVLITAPDLVWELPGKLFEYLGAGRPVLALAEGNEAARVVTETRIGWTVPPGDVGAIAGALERIAAGELRYEPDAAAIKQYLFPAPAVEAEKQIELAIARRPPG
jgi:glycosyltransferase involved in cell wall biosynthesis